MANKIGVLGEATNGTVGTHTVYTVPATSGARGRLIWRGTAGASSTISIAVNGITIFTSTAMTSGHVGYSSSALIFNSQTSAAGVDGSTTAKTVAQFAQDFFLGPSDAVTYTIGTAAFSDLSVQFVGAEVDVS